MITGYFLTLWSARIAFILYSAAIVGWLTGKSERARQAWTAGLLVYLSHVAAAFHFHHGWSHAAAYRQTARQTADLFGVESGSGLYLNYAFTALWTMDVIWMWWSDTSYRRRHRAITFSIHGFMAFLFFNASIVFVSGWPRWFGVAIIALVMIAARRHSRTRRLT